MCSPPSPTRSRTRGHRTATAPMPVTISRSGRCPWRTSRRRPSSVNLSVWVLSQAATSASTACPNSVLAPLRKTSVSGSENVPGWVSSKTLVSVTAYHSFGGEVEASNTPTIRRLIPSCRHQLSRIAHSVEFKRQIAQDFIAGETLHVLANRHDLSRTLIRIWVRKFEAGAFDDDAQAADLLQDYEAKIAALERMVGRQALEIEFLKGALKSVPRPRSASRSIITGPVASPSPKDAG